MTLLGILKLIPLMFVTETLDSMSLLSVNSVLTSYGDVMYTTCQSMRHAIAKSSCISVCSKAFLVGVNFLFLVGYLHIRFTYRNWERCSRLTSWTTQSRWATSPFIIRLSLWQVALRIESSLAQGRFQGGRGSRGPPVKFVAPLWPPQKRSR